MQPKKINAMRGLAQGKLFASARWRALPGLNSFPLAISAVLKRWLAPIWDRRKSSKVCWDRPSPEALVKARDRSCTRW